MSLGIRSPASYLATLVSSVACAIDFEMASGYTSGSTFLLGEILPLPGILAQIACASAVTRYWSSARAWGVSLNIDQASPETTREPWYLELTSGIGKNA